MPDGRGPQPIGPARPSVQRPLGLPRAPGQAGGSGRWGVCGGAGLTPLPAERLLCPPLSSVPPLSRGRRSLTSLTRLPPETSLWAAALGPSQSPPSVPRPVSRLSLARQGHLLPDLGSRRAGAGVLVARTGQNELRQTALLWTGERVPRLPPTGLGDTNWVTERAAAGDRPRNAVWPGAAGWHSWHRASRGLQPLPGCVSSPSEVLGPRGWTDRFLLLPAARACTPICPYGPHSPGTWGPRRGDGCG